MKVVLVVGWYFPDSSGGSEVYVGGLARELKKLGHDPLVVAPHDGEGERSYEADGIRVYRYPAGPDYVRGEAVGKVAPPSVSRLLRFVEREQPDLVHFHSWTRGAGYWHIRQVHEAGFPVFFTLHTASAFCARGTMWRWDRYPCDGEIRPLRCAACYFHSRLTARAALPVATLLAGLPLLLALVVRISIMPLHGFMRVGALLIATLAAAFPLLGVVASKRMKTAMEFPGALQRRKRQLGETWRRCRKVVSVCHWAEDALALNGCPRAKILLSRQGANLKEEKKAPPYCPGSVLRFGFLGRFDYVKGTMLLVEAFRRLPPGCAAVLELKGIPQDQDYLRKLNAVIAKDQRIRLVKPSPPDEVRKWMKGLDVLVVPSRWMETGPLVVYEAFLQQVPVIGAGHSGIAELVQDRVNGLIFKPQDVDDLARVLREVCEQPEILVRLRGNIGEVRMMRDVAVEMDALYRPECGRGS